VIDIKEIKYGKSTYRISEAHLNEVALDCSSGCFSLSGEYITTNFDTFLDGFQTSHDLHFLLSELQNKNGYLSIVLSFIAMKENNKAMRVMNTALNYGELN
jgi:hypothetical protein